MVDAVSESLNGLIHKRHEGDGWIVFEELGDKSGYKASRYADAFALGVWASTKYEAHLYEIKVSREDLKRELRDPTKAEGVGKHATFWWLMVSDEKVISDLVIPEAWGIIMPKKRGGSTIAHVLKKAPRMKPAAFDPSFAISMIRNMKKRWVEPAKHRAIEEELYAIKNGPPLSKEQEDKGVEVFRLERELKQLKSKIETFERHAGVSLSDTWNLGPIGDAVKIAIELGNHGDRALRQAVYQMSETAQSFMDIATRSAEAAVALRAFVGPEHAEWCGKVKFSAMSCRCGVEPLSDLERKASTSDTSPAAEGNEA